MRWVESDDARLAVYEEGDPGSPTILLVHGYPDSHRVWDEVAERLRDRFHVVRYDVRGTGASTLGRDGTLERLAGDLAAVLDSIGKPSVHLVGHDWGSLQGWDAVTRPGIRECVASFTSFGGPGLAQWQEFLRHGRRRDVLGQQARSWYMGVIQLPRLPELAWNTFLPKALERVTLAREGVAPRPGHPADTLAADARNGLRLYRDNMGDGAYGGDPNVSVPVQLIETTRDPFVSAALLDSLGQWVPRFWRRKIVAGHWAQRSHPDVVARMIAEFATHIDGGPAVRELSAARSEKQQKAFHRRLVVITGAGSGIGRATARAFAAHGAEIVCADLDLDAAARTADGIAKELGGTAHAVKVDVGDTEAMEAFAANVRAEHGVPDIVVNNAGIAVSGPFLDHSVDDWRRTLDVNLWGVIHGCRLFAAQMVERGEGGHIVNIASLAAFVPTQLLPAYSTSKAAVKMLGDCLRGELAGHGIGVTTICPGFISTAIARNAKYVGTDLRKAAEEAIARRGYPPERVAAHILRAVHRDRALVPVNAEGKIGYALSRISPGALRRITRMSGAVGNPPFAR
ncbi:SDR family oxidoreductase [Nonomuraea rhizosphaerae]|uniref:SDR family oxidoreductase n=1 Tax=Nonomuraea rhizosphaerae TaxID=2665663 RepID=UPI001C5FFD41|nr:SDR family oxidoreductase [Nonomuraea rhizosphaerae]